MGWYEDLLLKYRRITSGSTQYPPRSATQFVGATVTDDAVNDRTIVSIGSTSSAVAVYQGGVSKGTYGGIDFVGASVADEGGGVASVTTSNGTVTNVTGSTPISVATGSTTPVITFAIASQAQGDVVYFDGANWSRLAAGTSGQFLKTLGASANPAWAAAGTVTNVTGSSPISVATGSTTPAITFAIASQAQGDIVYFDGANWVRLAAGTSGNFLKTNGAAANPAWAAGNAGTVTNITSSSPISVATGSTTPVITFAIASQAQGDIIYFDGANWVRLAAGSSGQFLKTLGAAANPAWATVSAGAGTVTNVTGSSPISVATGSTTPAITFAIASQAQGDVVYFDGSNWVRLAAGTSGNFLKTNGASANPAWAAGNTGTVTNVTGSSPISVATGSTTPAITFAIASQAQGDVIYFDGSNWVRLAAGTSGQYLKTLGASANPAWSTVTASATLGVTITTGFNIPALGATVSATISDTSWMFVGQTVLATDGTHTGTFSVSSITSGTVVVLKWLNADGDSATTTTIANTTSLVRQVTSATFSYTAIGSSPYTHYPPVDLKDCTMIVTGPGGGGGSGGSNNGGVRTGGGGGGGGSRVVLKLKTADLVSPLTVTLGPGGLGGTASAAGAIGVAGAAGTSNTTVVNGAVTYATGYSGAGGTRGNNAAQAASTGAGGAGTASVGALGSPTSSTAGGTGGTPGIPGLYTATAGQSIGGTGGGGGTTDYVLDGGPAEWGGGGGSAPSSGAGSGGGASLFGAGGGGNGGRGNTSTGQAGGAGGPVGSYTAGSGSGGGAAGTTGSTGANGTAGDSTRCGGGGAGGGGGNTSNGGLGGTGGLGGGGGGGGGSAGGAAGTGGAGGPGGNGTVYFMYA